MKKQFLSILIMGVCVLPLSSFNSSKVKFIRTQKTQIMQTAGELGEFEQDGTVYSVYGDSFTGVISGIYFFNTGGPVYSWSGSYSLSDKHVNVVVYPIDNTGHFSYDGTLAFY